MTTHLCAPTTLSRKPDDANLPARVCEPNDPALANHAWHAQEAAKANAAAAHWRSAERVARKPRQESRDRNRAFEPRQRHPGALMRAGAEGEMPVRRAADVEVFRIGELRGIAVRSTNACLLYTSDAADEEDSV